MGEPTNHTMYFTKLEAEQKQGSKIQTNLAMRYVPVGCYGIVSGIRNYGNENYLVVIKWNNNDIPEDYRFAIFEKYYYKRYLIEVTK
jgi:hypothetical protein